MEKFICPLCGKELKNLQVYNTHLNYHKSKDQYPNGVECVICNKHFVSLKVLYRHATSTHTLLDKISIYESLHGEVEHLCKICGKESTFISVSKGYSETCSKECADILYRRNHAAGMTKVDYTQMDWKSIVEKREQTNLERTGYTNPLKNPAIRQKGRETMLEETGYDHPMHNPSIVEQRKENYIKEHGVDNPWKNPLVIQKCIETKKENLGEGQTLFTKCFDTCEAKTGYKFPQQNPDTRTLTKQNLLNTTGFDNPMKNPINKQKAKETKKQRYKNGNFREGIYTEEFIRRRQEKQYTTKKANKSFNKSKKEDELFEFLTNKFNTIILRQKYDSLRFPFSVDFYFPRYELFVDFNGNWTHGGEAFDSNNTLHLEKLNEWKSKCTDKKSYWQNAIYTWTDLDVRKRNLAKENNINYIQVFGYDFEKIKNIIIEKIQKVKPSLVYFYSEEEIEKELTKVYNSKGHYNSRPFDNKAILTYQPHFYEKENQLFKDLSIRTALIENRKKFLNKNEFTDKELLRGFKISGIYQGFSHFNWEWVNAFINEFNVNSIYDPCGGWGHRLLGSLHIKYIYNDIDIRTYSNTKSLYNMCKSYLHIKNTCTFYNKDASVFTPKEKYEAVFICPPYWNTERYTDPKSSSNLSYEDWLTWFENMIKASSKNCKKYVAVAIGTKFEKDVSNVLDKYFHLIKKQELGKPVNDFKVNKRGSVKEVLLVYSL